MGWIGCVLCEIFWPDFMARTFALITPVRPILNRVLYGVEMVLKAPKHNKMHQNMSLGSNGVDQERLLPNILTWFCGTNFCISRTSSAHFEPSFIRRWNGPKCTKQYETHQNMSLGSNGVNQVCSLRKIPTRHRGTNFCINCTSSTSFEINFIRQRNGSKCTQTVRNT